MRATENLTIETPRVKHGNILLHLIARLFFFVTRWQIKGKLPADRKLVVIGVPHTSNFDGIMLLMISWLLYLRLDWMVKAELGDHWLAGPPIHLLGGVSIDRSASRNAVDQTVRHFEERGDLWLVISPEGTRRKTDHWKTGFYWIAHKANVPILQALINYDEKAVTLINPMVVPSGDIEAEIEKIWETCTSARGRHPERVSDMRLRPSGKREQSGS